MVRKDVVITRANEKSHFFDSLVWQQKDGDEWVDHISITKDDFQRGSDNGRWVGDIHSFDPDTGVAILVVAEWKDKGSGASSVVRSWREWDVKSNKGIRLIRVRQDPFEPFEEPELR